MYGGIIGYTVEVKAYNTLVKQGRKLVTIHSNCQWDLGDLAAKVERTQLYAFADDIGINYSTLCVYRMVCIKFPPERRSKFNVSYSFFSLLASQPDADKLLQKVADKKLKWSEAKALVHARKVKHPRKAAIPSIIETESEEGTPYELLWPILSRLLAHEVDIGAESTVKDLTPASIYSRELKYIEKARDYLISILTSPAKDML